MKIKEVEDYFIRPNCIESPFFLGMDKKWFCSSFSPCDVSTKAWEKQKALPVIREIELETELIGSIQVVYEGKDDSFVGISELVDQKIGILIKCYPIEYIRPSE